MLVCINNNFYFVLIGHIIASISQAFIQNPVAKMAITWFGDKERG
jgi:FtsH-binding integral membrane protein